MTATILTISKRRKYQFHQTQLLAIVLVLQPVNTTLSLALGHLCARGDTYRVPAMRNPASLQWVLAEVKGFKSEGAVLPSED